ncbi:NADH dehydrogenase (ubiquinone) B14.5 B subunit [Calliopsis andreniformis]|uniref:NADH dehydrogenase (ubiquinone) B14.5 B subunit n=1 Tax=Calliopsis andreniformis TaxID=337506 RepID=UPI003FCDD041
MTDLEKNPAQWAIDLLEGKNYFYKKQFYNNYTAEIVTGITGFLIPCHRNIITKKPFYSNFHRHILFTLVGIAIGRVITIKADEHYAKNDAILLDYVKKHPERFPEPPNRKYAEIFNPWKPVR